MEQCWFQEFIRYASISFFLIQLSINPSMAKGSPNISLRSSGGFTIINASKISTPAASITRQEKQLMHPCKTTKYRHPDFDPEWSEAIKENSPSQKGHEWKDSAHMVFLDVAASPAHVSSSAPRAGCIIMYSWNLTRERLACWRWLEIFFPACQRGSEEHERKSDTNVKKCLSRRTNRVTSTELLRIRISACLHHWKTTNIHLITISFQKCDQKWEAYCHFCLHRLLQSPFLTKLAFFLTAIHAFCLVFSQVLI